MTPSADSKNELFGSRYLVLWFLSADYYKLELRARDNHLPMPLKSESSSRAKREQS